MSSTREVIENRLAGQHEVGMSIVLDTPEHILNQRPAPDKWNILEHFYHLVRYQYLFNQRVDLILSKNNPVLEKYSAETDTEFKKWLQQDKDWFIHVLINDRFVVFNRFREFSDKDLKRTGTHPSFGKLTLMDWHQFFVLHEAHHLHAMWKLSKMQ
jgi:DinB superfamily